MRSGLFAVIIGSMALAHGVLYRGTWDGTIMAVDAGDGTVLWNDGLDAPVAGGVAVADGAIFVGYGTGTSGNLGATDGGLVAYRLP